MQHNLLINGKLVAGEGEKVPVYNPATGEVIPRLPKRQRPSRCRR